MNDNEESSSSGEITSSFHNVSDNFTGYSEIITSGFNLLYKAQRYGKWFVLKGLKPQFRDDLIYRELLAKEFEVGIQLDHPNIAKCFGKEYDPVVGDCIILEFVDGVTLKEFLSSDHPKSVLVKIVNELLDAMIYYHSKQLIHRDLKPDNILITRNGNNVKIIDFGLSDSDTFSIFKEPVGSRKYAAPEQLRGDVEIDCRADIYAFGIILKAIFLRKIPPLYKTIIKKCTQSNRDLRYQHAEEIKEYISRDKTGNKMLWGIATSLLIVLMILTLAFFLRSPNIDKVSSYDSYIDNRASENTTSVNDSNNYNVESNSVESNIVYNRNAEANDNSSVDKDKTEFIEAVIGFLQSVQIKESDAQRSRQMRKELDSLFENGELTLDEYEKRIKNLHLQTDQ
ncbi:MAG: serine/threonine-protein kinase [Bacteroidales bacterium]|nr:serine/threonine-protein kinase [Bacteroidales bacterium]